MERQWLRWTNYTIINYPHPGPPSLPQGEGRNSQSRVLELAACVVVLSAAAHGLTRPTSRGFGNVFFSFERATLCCRHKPLASSNCAFGTCFRLESRRGADAQLSLSRGWPGYAVFPPFLSFCAFPFSSCIPFIIPQSPSVRRFFWRCAGFARPRNGFSTFQFFFIRARASLPGRNGSRFG